MEVAVKITKATLHLEGTPASIEQVVWWAPEPVWTVLGKKKILVPTGFRTPDLRARRLTVIPV